MTNTDTYIALRDRVRASDGEERFTTETLDEFNRALFRSAATLETWGLISDALNKNSIDAFRALFHRVLPGWGLAVDATAPDLGIDVDLFRPEPSGSRIYGTHALETHAGLIALLTALIEREPKS